MVVVALQIPWGMMVETKLFSASVLDYMFVVVLKYKRVICMV